MQSNSRIANTKRNIVWSFTDYTVSIFFQFISRTIIVQVLGIDYLGLSSLFSSILQVLNMAELGFSSAVIYNLYKPIANNDNKAVCALLSFYKKVYRVVGIIIFIGGIAISPFLRILIRGDVPLDLNIYILYFLYLTNSSVSYFVFAYKSSLLNALQRMDLTKLAYSIVNLCQCLFQIVVLLLFKNYYLFVIGAILGTVSRNLLAAWYADKYCPQYKCKGEVSKTVKKDIWQRVKGLLIERISGVTYTTFDSIILSAMIGLIPVAIYNNYMMVYSSVASIIVLIRHAMQASVGNSVASETVEKNYLDIFKWQFLFSSIAIWSAICLTCLYQPFMLLWMGETGLLSIIDVVFLSLLFVVNTVQHAFCLYLSGNGLWWNLRWSYIASAITNIVLNVILCRYWGITGIIFATLFAQFIFGLIWQCSIIFRDYFKKSVFPYYQKQIRYIVFGAIICILCYFLCSFVKCGGIVDLIFKAAICAVIPPILWILVFNNTNEFIECKKIAYNIYHKH